MKTPHLTLSRRWKNRKWFARQRRFHDPMLILSMSIFNSGRSWEQIFNPIAQRENVWS